MEIGEYVGVSTYTKMDCTTMNRGKLIKLILRTDPTKNLRSAKAAVDEFVRVIQSEHNEGETSAQRESAREDALRLYPTMLSLSSTYDHAVEHTKQALAAFNKEF